MSATYDVLLFVFVVILFFLMLLLQPRATRTNTLFPYTTLFRSQRVSDLAVHRGDGFRHALAEVASRVAVAQFDRFMRAGRGARRHRGAAEADRKSTRLNSSH